MIEPLIDYLSSRRTVPSVLLDDPGPNADTIDALIKIAARVPDHGKLAPWRFIVYDKAVRAATNAWLVERAGQLSDHGATGPEAEKARRFAHAPTVIGIVSSPRDHPKIPLWEQQLSAAAVCLNLIHAAHAHGFSAQWLTDWFSYDADAADFLGAKDNERFAGFIHIGTPSVAPSERDRPDTIALTTHWRQTEGS
jgi:nitroreductase